MFGLEGQGSASGDRRVNELLDLQPRILVYYARGSISWIWNLVYRPSSLVHALLATDPGEFEARAVGLEARWDILPMHGIGAHNGWPSTCAPGFLPPPTACCTNSKPADWTPIV